MLILSYENEFNLHVKEISFSYERMRTKTRFEEEAKGNLEMAYSTALEDPLEQQLRLIPLPVNFFACFIFIYGTLLPRESRLIIINQGNSPSAFSLHT